MKIKVQQLPVRNATTICVSVNSHSGEFAPVDTDLQLPGRGLDFKLIRSYRSALADHVGDFGRGWSSNISRRIERKGRDILYHDGTGNVYKFIWKADGTYLSPVGFYGIVSQEQKQFLLRERYGLTYWFAFPEKTGKLLRIEDRNGNSIQFLHSAKAIVVLDSLKRRIEIRIQKGLVSELEDHTGRKWKYVYDKNSCLTEVTQPETADFPKGTSVKYAYDENYRLISITDARDQKYLTNHYDAFGRVVTQEHGSGVFNVEYDTIGENKDGFRVHRTTCIRKNGGKLVLEHNDIGNVISRTVFVNKESFAPEDITHIDENDVPLVTKSEYNKNSELISRVFPLGNRTEWIYSEDEKSPLDRGNLLRRTDKPHENAENDQESIVTEYEYETEFQLMKKLVDPRGNKTLYNYDENGNLIHKILPSVTVQPVNIDEEKPAPIIKTQQEEYQYNTMGQLLVKKHIDGSIAEYYYYPVDDPIGTRGPNTAINDPQKLGGYLARVVRDANGKKIKTEYSYDNFGNATTVWDGKGNPARLRYNAMGKLESVFGREPFTNSIEYKYDANYNQIESIQSFERLEYDEKAQKTVAQTSILREIKEFNLLDNVVQRKIVGDEKVITETFIRDANENIVRQIQPLGNVTEFVYDERDLLIEKRLGVGTRESFSNRLTYNFGGFLSSFTDGNGQRTTHHYDGFNRYKGFSNPIGTRKTQWFDESGNVVRVEINGGNSQKQKKAGSRNREDGSIMETNFHFDEWNRVYRVDNAWRDSSNNQALGQSKWNGEKGIISSVVEYAENGLAGKVWTEANNVMAAEYDGLGRIVRITDQTGDEFSFEYDENNNPTLLKYLGPDAEGGRAEKELKRRYDQMDRLVWQQENESAPEKFQYNELGHVSQFTGKSGMEVHYLEDALGRRVGQAFTIDDPLNAGKAQKMERVLEYDDNYRLAGYTDAVGNRTTYRYDALDRRTGIIFPNGKMARVEFDANGNVIKEVDQNDNEINNRYDASNRLVERRSLTRDTEKETVENFEYDGINRLITARTPDVVIRQTYDSLSRVLTEQQGEYVLQYAYDSMGNRTNVVYPGGEEVHKKYDARNRVASAEDKAGETIASFVYRANDQVASMFLGKVIKTDFTYNQQQRLESIEYRKTDDHQLVDGYRYQYDDTGRITHEIQLSEGATYGERYFYDNAGRATKAQYGVRDVFDPTSAFEQETTYEHFPEGSWKRRADVDGRGRVIDENIGTINQLNKYQSFGGSTFTYDANGNCIRKSKARKGYWKYTYDKDNRLVKSECFDARGNRIQTIEYYYDALGRQVRKVVTDKNGNRTDFTFVWSGSLLIEEYENGILVRTYFYGAGSLPVQLSVFKKDARTDLIYVHNGKGLATGLVDNLNPSQFFEKYSHELTGATAMKEINGVKIPIPFRDSSQSSILNSITGSFGSFNLTDWLGGTLSGLGGKHMDSKIGALMNGFDLGYSGGSAGAMGRQTQGFLDVMGLGGGGNVTPSEGKQGKLPPGVTNPNDPSLYGVIWDVQKMDISGPIKTAVEKPSTTTTNTTTFKDGSTTTITRTTNVDRSTVTISNVDETGRTTSTTITNKDGSKVTIITRENKDGTTSTTTITDPAPATTPAPATKPMTDGENNNTTQSAYFSTKQVEAKLMSNKTPVNPNGGPRSVELVASSLKPRRDDDPTIAYFDGEFMGYGGGGGGIIFGGGYADPMRPDHDPSPRGAITNGSDGEQNPNTA